MQRGALKKSVKTPNNFMARKLGNFEGNNNNIIKVMYIIIYELGTVVINIEIIFDVHIVYVLGPEPENV